MLLTGTIRIADWYENIEHGLRTIGSIFGATLIGAILGLIIYGPTQMIGGTLVVGFVAEVTGVFCAFYLYYRDKKETSRQPS